MAGRKGRSGGHNRLSPAEHLLRGTWNVTRHGPRPATIAPTVRVDPNPPAWLHEEAQTEWRRLAPVLGQHGALAETDADALAAYCEAFTTWKHATARLRQFGMVVKRSKADGELPVISPYVKIAHQAMAHMRAFLVEFGMTPSSRGRVQVRPPASDPVSKWGRHL
jgi:P27 family predicted phage terminase small subunit